jgi:6-carboxyhexanoate--coA ligase
LKYSVKMRASKNIDDKDLHIGGAEKIIDESELLNVVNKLTLRGLNHSRGDADFINLKINKVFEEDIIKVKALKTRTIDVKDSNEGLSVVRDLLTSMGISDAQKVIDLLVNTNNMRGAIILNILDFKRMESDKEKGVRVTNMDYDKNKDVEVKNHRREALCLATKTLNAKAIIGEVCISDDSNYVTGYVASKNEYIRITKLKEKGDYRGGRIFLFDPRLDTIENTINYLENQLVVVYE